MTNLVKEMSSQINRTCNMARNGIDTVREVELWEHKVSLVPRPQEGGEKRPGTYCMRVHQNYPELGNLHTISVQLVHPLQQWRRKRYGCYDLSHTTISKDTL